MTASARSHFWQHCRYAVYSADYIHTEQPGDLFRIEFGGFSRGSDARIRDQNIDSSKLLSQTICRGPYGSRVTNVSRQKECPLRGGSTLKVSFLSDLFDDFEQSRRRPLKKRLEPRSAAGARPIHPF